MKLACVLSARRSSSACPRRPRLLPAACSMAARRGSDKPQTGRRLGASPFLSRGALFAITVSAWISEARSIRWVGKCGYGPGLKAFCRDKGQIKLLCHFLNQARVWHAADTNTSSLPSYITVHTVKRSMLPDYTANLSLVTAVACLEPVMSRTPQYLANFKLISRELDPSPKTDRGTGASATKAMAPMMLLEFSASGFDLASSVHPESPKSGINTQAWEHYLRPRSEKSHPPEPAASHSKTTLVKTWVTKVAAAAKRPHTFFPTAMQN